MNGIQCLHVFMFLNHPPDGTEHGMHGLSQVFPPVGCQQDQPAVSGPFQVRMGEVLPYGSLQRVNHRITRHIDRFRLLAFPDQVVPAQGRGSKVPVRQDGYARAVKLLRIGRKQIIGSQAGFHMAHRNLQIKAGQCRRESGACISMHKNRVRLFLLQHVLHALQHPCGDVKQGLALLHDCQVIVRLHVEGVQHLLQHALVLSCDAHQGFNILPGLQFLDQGTHLDCFRPGAENQHNLLTHRPSPPVLWIRDIPADNP